MNGIDSIISRRLFFRKCSSKLLAVFALPFVITGCDKDDPLIDINPGCQDCTNACKGTCFNTCKETCQDGCKGTCKGTCQTYCSTNCSQGCVNSCQNSCSGDCSNSCWGDCSNTSRWNSMEKLESRRKFFKKCLTRILPVMALLVVPQLVIKAEPTKPTIGCNGSCMGSCKGNCKGSCKGGCRGCQGGCQQTCKAMCGYVCGGCAGSCKGLCAVACGGSCKGSCHGGSTKIISDTIIIKNDSLWIERKLGK